MHTYMYNIVHVHVGHYVRDSLELSMHDHLFSVIQ